jgi:hypothetical protein
MIVLSVLACSVVIELIVETIREVVKITLLILPSCNNRGKKAFLCAK